MDHRNGNHSMGMMWLMMLGCALPIIFTLFAGSSRLSSVVWVLLGFGAMFGIHVWMMRRMHGSEGTHDERPDAPRNETTRPPDAPSDHTHH